MCVNFPGVDPNLQGKLFPPSTLLAQTHEFNLFNAEANINNMGVTEM